MKQAIIFSIAMAISLSLQAQIHITYDFSSVSPTGQILYYRLINNDSEVMVVNPMYNTRGNISNRWYNPSGNIIIPDTVEYMGARFPVTRIGQDAFSECTAIISVTLPETIRSIDDYAFRKSSLIKIELSSNLEYIGREAFSRTSIAEVELPEKIEEIRNGAFSYCKHLKKVVILCEKKKTDWSEKSIFTGCNYIKEVVFERYYDVCIPKDNLEQITFGKGVYSISTSFQGYTHLKKVVIGDAIKKVPNDCFNECNNLRVVVLGKNVSKIGERAFRMCLNLDTIIAKPQIAPTLDSNAFIFTPSTKVVVLNCNADYSTTWGTTGFDYNTVDTHTITLGVNCLSCGSVSFNQKVDCNNTAIVEATPFENYMFSEWSDGNTDNPRNITISSDTTLNAMFVRNAYSVIAKSNNITMGNVAGSSRCHIGDSITLSAIAVCGYRFSRWNNGITDNPITFIPSSDTNMVALFEIALDTIYIPDTNMIPIVIYDTTIHPVSIYDTTMVNVILYDTTIMDITLYDTMVYPMILYDTTIVNVSMFDTMRFTIPFLDSIQFNTQNVDPISTHDMLIFHDTIIIHDTIVTEIGKTSIVNAKIYKNKNSVVVEGARGEKVILCNEKGEEMAIKGSAYSKIKRFDVPASGFYIVKIGDLLSRKVAVIR